MSIEKYTTKAFILKEYERDENDMVYKVWTRDFGVIFVLARSIRKINAKLRMMIKKNDFILITIVKGKDLWRLTGVEEQNKISINSSWQFKAKKIIAEAISKLIEEKKTYKKLFDRLESIFILDENYKIFSLFDTNKFKLLITYIVLVDTGYADARIIGAKDLEEYKTFSMKDFYTYFVLNEKEVKSHVLNVLKEIMI
ncbi:MAG: repair protein RecO [Patescibacteria group bacterium]|nr:repair protein RecO [Patescibacteria group bacterium]